MSNNEVFSKIFNNVSTKIINKYLTDFTIKKLKNNKWKYTSNINKNNINNLLFILYHIQ